MARCATTTRGEADETPVHDRVQARHPGGVRAPTEPGAKGALLRREGLYSSHIVEWRRARDVGALAGLAPKHRQKRSSRRARARVGRKRNERLEGKLAQHQQALEIQGKASELLARLLAESADTEDEQQP